MSIPTPTVSQVSDLDTLAREVDGADYDPSGRYSRCKPSLSHVVNELRYHAVSRYRQFDPCSGDDFERRILAWINNVDLDRTDQIALIRLLPEIAFIDQDEMKMLYKTAFSHQICRWLMDQERLDFRAGAVRLENEMAVALQRTWFCALTDSLDIALFCHVNRVAPHAYRPQWHTLKQFGSKRLIRDYIATECIERLVVLEDIVGSGSQSSRILADVAQTITSCVPLLFVPLIISDNGLRAVQRALGQHSHCSVAPVSTIASTAQVRRKPVAYESEFVATARSIIERTRARFTTNPYGYGGVGTLIVLHTNCPNNTPPFVWCDRTDWHPLFPRVSRSAAVK